MLGKRLRQLRTERGLSQAELGKLFGLDNTTISSYERGNSAPNNELLTKLADYFKVSVDYLLGRTDDPTGQTGVAASPGQADDDDELYVVFRGKRQELPPEYKRVLIDMMEAAHRKMAEEKQTKEKGQP